MNKKRKRLHSECGTLLNTLDGNKKWRKRPQQIKTLDGVFSVMVWTPGNDMYKFLNGYISQRQLQGPGVDPQRGLGLRSEVVRELYGKLERIKCN